MTAEGVVLVDKPAGPTSHDVVARVRRLAGTRRVGHAGTLDPMATGLLVLGIGRATRLLGHLALHDKDYAATVRLGATTVTDDAQGDVLAVADASGVTDDAVLAVIATLTGEIEQVPSAVSAIKVDGVRSYRRVREGEAVELAPRRVRVARFGLVGRSGADLHVEVTCSSGTYVRALARDLGAALGVGAHLCALRRTRVGGYDVSAASTLEELAERFEVVALAEAAAAAFPRLDLDADSARVLGHGGRLSGSGLGQGPGPVAAFGPDGSLLALVEERDGALRALAVFPP